jgi:hypothetical protein
MVFFPINFPNTLPALNHKQSGNSIIQVKQKYVNISFIGRVRGVVRGEVERGLLPSEVRSRFRALSLICRRPGGHDCYPKSFVAPYHLISL